MPDDQTPPEPKPAEEIPPQPVPEPQPPPAAEVPADPTAKYIGCVGKTFTKAEKTGTIKNFERKALAQGVWGPTFWVNFGNPRVLFPMNADLFLKEYKEKGN